MNELQRMAVTQPLAYATQIGREYFKVLKNSPHNASVGLSLNRS